MRIPSVVVRHFREIGLAIAVLGSATGALAIDCSTYPYQCSQATANCTWTNNCWADYHVCDVPYNCGPLVSYYCCSKSNACGICLGGKKQRSKWTAKECEEDGFPGDLCRTNSGMANAACCC